MINVLDRIVELRLERNWTEYQLAKEAGIAQSTINSWYRRNSEPSASSIIKICDAFHITRAQLYMEDKDWDIPEIRQINRLLPYVIRLTPKQFMVLLLLLQTFR